MHWEEKNRMAMEERKFCIPGANDALMVGLAEDEPPHLKKHGSRYILIHTRSGLRLRAFNAIEGWALGQVSFFANWIYRRFPNDHWLWAETNAEKFRGCLEPIVEQGLDTSDWSGYQNARKFEIEQMARLMQLVLDYGVRDLPDDEEPEDFRQICKMQREENAKHGHPPPGHGYEDSPDQDRELFHLRLTYVKRKYIG